MPNSPPIRILQKPVAAIPFVGSFCAFGAIARATGRNDIFGAIGAAARQRDHMIGMVGVAKFAIAVIAFATLGLILTAHIGSGMRAIGGGLADIIVSVFLVHALLIGNRPLANLCIDARSICLPVFNAIADKVFSVLCIIGASIGTDARSISRMIGPVTRDAMRAKPILRPHVVVEMFSCRGLNCLALCTSLEALRRCGWRPIFAAFLAARFAYPFASIWVSPGGVEISEGRILFACIALFELGYAWGMIVHVISSFQLIDHAAGCYQHRRGNSIGCYQSILAQMGGFS